MMLTASSPKLVFDLHCKGADVGHQNTLSTKHHIVR